MKIISSYGVELRKQNIPIRQTLFDFDIRFPKMPSYLRRAAIQHALGSVSSYKTRLGLWEKTGQRESKPRLVYENHAGLLP